MSRYHDLIDQYSLKVMLDAIADADGSQYKAAEALGIHRNTISRELTKQGWDVVRVRRYCEEHNPVFRAKKEATRRRREHQAILRKPVQMIGLEMLLNESPRSAEKYCA